jgi:hypothetical protein
MQKAKNCTVRFSFMHPAVVNINPRYDLLTCTCAQVTGPPRAVVDQACHVVGQGAAKRISSPLTG